MISSACKDDSFTIVSNAGAPAPKNTFLADSHWPISHANTYAQASTEMEGPVNSQENYKLAYKQGSPGMITMVVSGPYSNGEQVIWGANVTHIVKFRDTGNGFEVIDKYEKQGLVISELLTSSALSGAYTLIDDQNEFYVPQRQIINVFGDVDPGNADSPIQLLRTYQVPQNLLIDPEELIVGFNMLYDGNLVYVTENGLVGVIDRNFSSTKHLQLPNEDLISNSIAVDEDGGIYVVTSENMYRVQWTGSELTINEQEGGWTAAYETGSGTSAIRLGEGSGSTPSLMGTGSEDKFVVITDGQDLMHLVLFWRDQIPADWQQIEGTQSRRIAAQVPITFGDADANISLSEQSVCVSGYGAVVVNNLLASPTGNFIGDILSGGDPLNTPSGVEKFVWNPTSREFTTAWVNNSVSYPNGIPCMSSSSNMLYDIGLNAGVWNFTGLNWSTGAIVFKKPLGYQTRYNSAYAATEISLHKGLYSGTILGATGIWEE